MLFATAAKKLNRLLAPAILKHGLTARFVLARGNIRDNPYLDYALLLPLAQTLLSIEIQEVAKEQKQKQLEKEAYVPSAFDEFVDRVWNQYIEPYGGPTADDEKEPSDNLRLDVFEQFLSPVLTPTQEWSDIERYRFNARFIKWLRSEYLICKYGSDIRMALAEHTQLRVTPLLQRNAFKETIRQGMIPSNLSGTSSLAEGFAPLPKGSTLDKAFRMEHWEKGKRPHGEYEPMREIVSKLGGYMEALPGSNVEIATVPVESSTKDLSFEEILEVSGCHVSSCNAFNALCEESGIYEFWTEDYVSGLTQYLLDRSEKFDGETLILDVGAGDGTLVHFVQKYMREFHSGKRKGKHDSIHKKNSGIGRKKSKRKISLPTVVATDDGSWKIDPKADVEKISVTEALEKYSPFDEHGKRKHQLIVLCSWMPMGVDWSQEIRDAGADEYILIGECDDGNCGDNWYTFGNAEFKDDIYLDEKSQHIKPSVIASYKADGFKRIDLDDLSRLQYSRFDSSVSGSSKSISFRRLER